MAYWRVKPELWFQMHILIYMTNAYDVSIDYRAGAHSNLLYFLKKANKLRYMYIRPGLRKNLLNYLKTFLFFECHYDITIFDLTPHNICAYIEFLLHSFKCPGTVRIYVSGLSTLCAWLQTIFKAFPVKQCI